MAQLTASFPHKFTWVHSLQLSLNIEWAILLKISPCLKYILLNTFPSYALATFSEAIYWTQTEISICWDFWFSVGSGRNHSTGFNKPLWRSYEVPRAVLMKRWVRDQVLPSRSLLDFVGGEEWKKGSEKSSWKGTEMDCDDCQSFN